MGVGVTIGLAVALALAWSLAVGSGFLSGGSGARAALPFYDGADFTPRWTTTVAHHIEDFRLVTQTGAPFTRADLDGRVHVASFIYTHCAGVCPMMIERLSDVQRAMEGRPEALLVSFSVTPSTDTPETLAVFGAERRIDAGRWKLVTGDAGQIYRLARRSYFADDDRLGVAAPDSEPFLHTEKLLLVDQQGRLRGVYNGTLAREIEKLIVDMETLLGSA
jgi:protein SCO1/2